MQAESVIGETEAELTSTWTMTPDTFSVPRDAGWNLIITYLSD